MKRISFIYKLRRFITLFLLLTGTLVFKTQAQNEFELLLAAESGDSARVVELLKAGASPNTTYNTGETALILAAKKKYYFIVRQLVDNGAFINIKSTLGTTALMFITDFGNIELLKYMVSKGGNLKQDEAKLLILATQKSRLDILKYLVDENYLNVNAKDEEGKTAFIQACMTANMETIKYLLDKGADINAKNDTWDNQYHAISLYGTPLMHAVALGRMDVMNLLIEKGAKIDEKTNKGNTALTVALECAQFDAARLLVEKGAFIDDQDKNGYTPLMLAAVKNNLEIVKYLVDKGAVLNMKNKKGKTVYDILTIQKKMEGQVNDKYSVNKTDQILKYLKSKGAKPGEKV
jgi:ankyrin repeat protein